MQILKLLRNRHKHRCFVSVGGFTDTSERAYVHLLVASKMLIGLAKIELCAYFSLARQMRVIITTYSERCDLKHILAIIDNTVALVRTHSCPTRWQIFIALQLRKFWLIWIHDIFITLIGKQIPVTVCPAVLGATATTPALVLLSSICTLTK